MRTNLAVAKPWAACGLTSCVVSLVSLDTPIGLIPLTAQYFFDKQVEYRPRITFCEIYNEKVYDLLAPPPKGLHSSGRPALKIRSGANGRFYVDGLVERHGDSLEQLLAFDLYL